MTTLTRNDFLAQLLGNKITVARLTDRSLAAADVNRDGKIEGSAELSRLFTEIDRLDRDGNRDSLELGTDGSRTAAGRAVASILALAEPSTAPTDTALALVFGDLNSPLLPIQSGKRGQTVLAVQYALGRLGHFNSLCDSSFGPKTLAAVQAFQTSRGLAATGSVDRETLKALDAALLTLPKKVPAAMVSDPLAYLSDFGNFNLSRVQVRDRTRPLDFNHPEIRTAYGTFCAEYWQVMKENKIECDCKTVGLFLMRQFRAKAASDLGVTLPMPSKNGSRMPNTPWAAFTSERTGGYFSRVSALPVVRPGYSAPQAVQTIDKEHSMLYGVNVRQNGLNADAVSRYVHKTQPWSAAKDNRGDTTKPEIDVDALSAGEMIFMDHKGDGKFDHAMTVVGLERSPSGRVSKLTLAIGSFDDMKDANGDTPPVGPREINQYAEELEIHFDADGRITDSNTTWTSEPSFLAAPRYTHKNTIMELRAGGTIFVGLWGA